MKHKMEKEKVTLLTDRRSNPFIRTRQRINFDRRKSYRMGSTALAFLCFRDNIVYGNLKDISDSGACLELKGLEEKELSNLEIDIPLLYGKKIRCELSWTKQINHNNGYDQYGLKFIKITGSQQNELRKSFLLNKTLLMAHAQELMKKTDDFQKRQAIKTFFLIDVKMAIENLIDIQSMIADENSDEKIEIKCRETLDGLVNVGDELESFLNNASLTKEIKHRVRDLIGHFIYQSTVFRRGFEKPRGYPGDYNMLEIVYDNRVVSEGIGEYIDRYGLDVPYSVAIRLRKDKMRDILYNFINNSSAEQLKILNLASGSCRDIREMFALPIRYKGNVKIICVDQDDEAISFVKKKLSDIDTGDIDIDLIKGNIMKLESLEIGKDNSFDMIYSIGIADYLQNKMLEKIFRDCYRKLKPGGTLVVAYKDRERHKPIDLNWYGDWNFVLRNEEEAVRLINGALGEENISTNIERENSGIIFYTKTIKNN